jgi:hypothetical protein
MRLIFLFVCLIFGATAYAFDLQKDMTPVSCKYSNSYGKEMAVKVECGNFKLCQASVICSYVENKAFKDEFKGDRAAAAKAADGWFSSSNPFAGLPRAFTIAGKVVWSEVSGSPPKFITSESSADCLTKQGTCPSPLTCLLDPQVTDIKDFETKTATSSAQEGQHTGSTR